MYTWHYIVKDALLMSYDTCKLTHLQLGTFTVKYFGYLFSISFALLT